MEDKNDNVLNIMDKTVGFGDKLKSLLKHVAGGSAEMLPAVFSFAKAVN
jgi:hypothetical protein